MIKYSYEIKDLIETFKNHHDILIKREKELDIKYPDRQKEIEHDFSLALAMKTICEEIQKIKLRLQEEF